MEIRWLKPEEYEAAFKLVADYAGWMEKPNSMLLGQFDGEELVGIIGVTRPVVIEPLVMKEGYSAKSLILALDQRLDPSPYFCFVKDEGFQKVIERYYDDNVEGFTGKLYVRKRGYSGRTEGKQRGTSGIERPEREGAAGVRAEEPGQGEDSAARLSPDGTRDRPADFHVVSAGAVDFGHPKAGSLK